MRLKREFTKYDLFMLDCDGVVWRGESPINSAIKAIKLLEEMGKEVVFITNNATQSRADYARKFARFGLHIPTNRIYTSGYGTAIFLRENGLTAYIVGEEGLRRELEEAGVIVLDDAESVVVALDRGINYEKIAHASMLIRNGAFFIATNRDATIPTELGEMPGAGALVAAVEVASGKNPDIIIGKPEPYLFKLALEESGVPRDKALVIGDRLETDILGAKRSGIDSLLVLTGVTKKNGVGKGDLKPMFIVDSLLDLFE